MFNPAILKKKKATDVVKMNKEDSKYALKSLSPELEDKKEKESPKKMVGPEAKLEIEIMLQAAKKKKT